MLKSLKINLILISIIVLGTIGYFGYSNAATRSIAPPRSITCTGTDISSCSSWDICINGIKICNGTFTKTPANCTGGSSIPAPTSTCPLSQSARTASGYAWSDNIGYISFSGNISTGSSYGVYVDPTTGMFSGYAWSDNIGWIKFGGLSSFPIDSGTISQNAQLVSGKIVGWARACIGTQNGDCSTMLNSADGWDGWISLSGSGYGASLNVNDFFGYAWGSNIMGWISLTGVKLSALPTPMTVSLKASPSSVLSGGVTTLSLTMSGTSGYCDLTGSDGEWVGNIIGSYTTRSLTSPTTFTANCKDINGNSVSTSTIVTIEPPLTVTLNAGSEFVALGNLTDISWNSSMADSCTVTKNVKGVSSIFSTATSGVKSSGPITDITTFTVVCSNTRESLSKSVNIIVNPIIETNVTPITLYLRASSNYILSGSSTTIAWNSTGSDSCTVTKSTEPGWTVIGQAGYKSSGPLTATTTFTATCTNSYTTSKYVYNYNGTYKVPTSVNSITVEAWGGGGSGGSQGFTGGSSGGGGGGGYGKQTFTVAPGTNYVVTVGDTGGISSFGNLISASGGGNGAGYSGQSAAASGGSGGISNATTNAPGIRGSNGVPGNVQANGGSGGAAGGPGGGSGGSGGSVSWGTSNGGAGTAPGGGGGGSGTSNSGAGRGGVGAKGRVTVTPNSGIGGTNSTTTSITVGVRPSSLIITLTANPTPVLSGGTTTITWSTFPATLCTVTNDRDPSWTGSSISSSKISQTLTASTTFIATCGTQTKSIEVGIITPPKTAVPTNLSAIPDLSDKCNDRIILTWISSQSGNKFKIYRDGVNIASNITTLNYIDSVVGTSTHIYYVVANNSMSGDSELSNTASAKANQCPVVIVIPPPPVTATCVPSQDNGPLDNNIYSNKIMRWTVTLSTTSIENINTKWSGTEMPETAFMSPGLVYDYMYMDASEPKTVNATIIGNYTNEERTPFTSSCSTSTKIKPPWGVTTDF